MSIVDFDFDPFAQWNLSANPTVRQRQASLRLSSFPLPNVLLGSIALFLYQVKVKTFGDPNA